MNRVFIATSLDGYIADKDNDVEWLHSYPNPDNSDLGYQQHIANIDAIVMGRKTMELVNSFDCDWPYALPVIVLSETLSKVPENLITQVELMSGSAKSICERLATRGYENLYIDGGATIQQFLQADLIDEMIITTIPILLGGGIPLFSDLESPLRFKAEKTEILIDALVQTQFIREQTRI